MDVRDTALVRELARMAQDADRRGWHERNGGNLSWRIGGEEAEALRQGLEERGPWKPCGVSVPELAGELFLVTGSGMCFRDMAGDPEATLAIIELDGAGEAYRLCWGLSRGGRPTSELPSHLMSHAVRRRAKGEGSRVIYHAHPANLIALTFVLPLTEEAFTRELWEMMPECAMVFPAGVGVLGWMVPGSRELAEATGRLLERYDAVIWAHHGVLCAGESPSEVFGLVDTMEKGAEILVKVLSMAGRKRQTATSEELRALSEGCGLELAERFIRCEGLG